MPDGLLNVDLEAEAEVPSAYIITRPSGYWTPAHEHAPGRLAALLPVENTWDEIIDIVAWHPEHPTVWWLRTGLGEVLGQYFVDYARWLRSIGIEPRTEWVSTPAEFLARLERCDFFAGDPLIACRLQRRRSVRDAS